MQEKMLKNCVTVGVLDTTTTQVSNEILFSRSSNKNRSWYSNILAYWTEKYPVLLAKRMKSDRKFVMEGTKFWNENFSVKSKENFLDPRSITNCFFIQNDISSINCLDSWNDTFSLDTFNKHLESRYFGVAQEVRCCKFL